MSVVPSGPLGIIGTGLFTVEQLWALLIKTDA